MTIQRANHIQTILLTTLIGIGAFTLKTLFDFNGKIEGIKAEVSYLKEMVMDKISKITH